LKALYDKYAYLFPLAMAAAMPFLAGVPVVIVLWLLCFLLGAELRSSMQRLLRNPWFYIVTAFFVLHALGYFYAANKPEAMFSIEIKLSYLALPFLFFSSAFRKTELIRIALAFIISCISVCLFNLGRALYFYLSEGVNYFYYSDFSYFMHPSYLAMYLVLAVLMLIVWYPRWYAVSAGMLTFLLGGFVLLSACVFLSSSKMGILAYGLLVPATVLYLQLTKKRYKLLLTSAAGLVLAFALAYHFFPHPFYRIRVALQASSEQQIDKTSTESTAVRKLIWHEAGGIIKKNTWTGVSPGDANDALYTAYAESGLTGALSKHLNAHNQYLQTFIGLGLPGMILLTLMTLGTLVLGLIRRNCNLFLFSLLTILNFMVESMLQTQAGVLFHAFFLCFFLQYDFGTFKPVTLEPKPKHL